MPYQVPPEEGIDPGVHLVARKMILVSAENIVRRNRPLRRIWVHVDVVVDLKKQAMILLQ